MVATRTEISRCRKLVGSSSPTGIMRFFKLTRFLLILQGFACFHRSFTYAIDEWYRSLCKNIENKSPTMQLKSHLFCDYDPTVRPVTSEKNVTTVELLLYPKFIEFIDSTDTLVAHSWLMLSWVDEHLKWDPAKFDGIEFLRVVSGEFWMPDLVVYNPGDLSLDQLGLPLSHMQCGIEHKGKVTCMPEVKHVTRCEADYSSWPFDVQMCKIFFGSWSYHKDELNISLYKGGIVTKNYKPSWEWDLKGLAASVNVSKFKFNNDYVSPIITFFFVIQRRATMMQIGHLTPAVVLMLLTLTTLWLDPSSKERMIVSCVSFICHLICMQDLFWRIPYDAFSCPSIVLFYERSLALTTVALILTAVLRHFQKMTTPAPNWISSTTLVILKSKAGQYLLLNILDPKASAGLEVESDDNSSLVYRQQSTPKEASSWKYFVILIGWISFLSVLLAYIVMMIFLFPVNPW